MTDRTPPHSADLEMQVLGAMMLSRSAISRAVALIDAQTFYRSRHQEIFDAIVRLYEAGSPVDLSLLVDELERRGVLEECGGAPYIGVTAGAVGTSVNVEFHATQLIEKSVRRRTIALATQLVTDSHEGADIYASLETFERELFGLQEKRLSRGFAHVDTITGRVYDRIEEAARSDSNVTGVPSGFERLDDLTAGFQPGELIIVAARPGMGKSAFVLNVARNAAVRHNTPVGVFSLEMSSESVTQRYLCMEGRVDGQALRTGQMTDPLWTRLGNAVQIINGAPLYVDDTAGISPLEIRAKARRLVQEHGAKMIIVDYLQLVRVARRLDNRALEVGEISQSLKALAKDLHVPVVACSQVTREVEKRGSTRPRLSDLRESGSIEQDADVVMFVHRPEYYGITHDDQGRSLEGVAEIIIEKQRNGPTGLVYLRWFEKYGAFEQLAPEEFDELTVSGNPPPEEPEENELGYNADEFHEPRGR